MIELAAAVAIVALGLWVRAYLSTPQPMPCLRCGAMGPACWCKGAP